MHPFKKLKTKEETKMIKREDRLKMDVPTHKYIDIVNNHTFSISVTGFKHFFMPDFDVEMILKQMFKTVDENGKIPSSSQSDYRGMSRGQVLRAFKKTAEEGTKVHAMIEHFLIKYLDDPNIINLSREEQMKLICPLGEKLSEENERCCMQFFDFIVPFIKEQQWIPYRMEMLIFIEEYDIAGSIDCIFKKRGKEEYAVIDWKRTKTPLRQINYKHKTCFYPFEEYNSSALSGFQIQVNLYAYILKHKYDLNVTLCAIVQLNPKQKKHKFEVVGLIENDIVIGLRTYKKNLDFMEKFKKWSTDMKASFSNIHPSLPFPCYYEDKNEYENSNSTIIQI